MTQGSRVNELHRKVDRQATALPRSLSCQKRANLEELAEKEARRMKIGIDYKEQTKSDRYPRYPALAIYLSVFKLMNDSIHTHA